MAKSNFIYINWEQVNHVVISCGLSDADFASGIPSIPQHLVLIDGQNEGDRFNGHTRFQTVNGSTAVRQFLVASTPYPKMWLDFHEAEDLDLMMPNEIAELLYMVHMKTHLHVPLYAKLQNDYTYLTVSKLIRKVYYRDLSTFNHVFEVSLKRHLQAFHSSRWAMFNRPLTIGNLPVELFNQLAAVFSEGLLVGFDRTTERNNQYQIPLFAQRTNKHANWWREQADVYATTELVAVLTYLINQSRWELTIKNPVPFENHEDDL